MKKLYLIVCTIFSSASLFAVPISGIFDSKTDSNYVESYYNDLILRVYTGEKNHFLELKDLTLPYVLNYSPDNFYAVGIGFNYRDLGLNIGTRMPFLSNEKKHGESSFLGLQSYIYSRRFFIDLLVSSSEGYYLKKSEEHLPGYNSSVQYQRPDISSVNVGLSFNYVFNYRRFSYKAAFNQTDRQKKSAGSVIAGFEAYSFKNKADSALVPQNISATYFAKARDVKNVQVLALNANVGYAYSFVFWKNFIMTGSCILGTGLQNNKFNFQDQEDSQKYRFSFRTNGRFSLGYQYDRYYLGISFIRSKQFTNLKASGMGVSNGTNFMRLSFSKRFSLKAKH